MSKSVLLLCSRFLPDLGGVEIHIAKVAKELQSRGYEVTVQSTTSSDDDSKYPYNVIRTRTGDFVPKEDYDIIVAHDFYIYSKNLWDFSSEVYCVFHGWEGEFPVPNNIVQKRRDISQEVLGSIQIGAYIEKWYGTQGRLCWGGIDPIEDKGNYLNYKDVFVFVGQLRKDLELEKYLKILSYLNHRVKLDVIGEGDIDYYSNLCNNYSIDVTFYGAINSLEEREKFFSIYNKAGYVLGGGYLSILQAMLNEKEVIATYSNDLKRDYIEWFPGKMISGPFENEGIDLAMRINEGLPLEIIRGNAKWASSQSWARVADIYENMWKND